LALGYRVDENFGDLTLEEVVAICGNAPPNSSIKDALEAGWSRTDHLLANLQEADAGMSRLSKPYERPGQTVTAPDIPTGRGKFGFSEMTEEELDRRLKERYALSDEQKNAVASKTVVRALGRGAA